MRQANLYKCLQEARWQRFVLLFAFLPALLALSSCGGGSSAATNPTITVSCAASTVTVGQQDQCTATVLNLSSTLVNWTVSGTGTGTIDSGGLYTAPATLPTTNVVTITAAAQAKTSLTATTTVTIQQATAVNAVTCADSNKNPSSTVSSGQSLACTATSSSGTPISVFWTLSGSTPGANIGTITAQGNYTAPLIPPPGQTVTITATSQAVATQTKSVTVNVVFGNAALQGPYAFSTSGRVVSTNAFFARAGSFTASCTPGCAQGSLIGGIEDSNQGGTVKTLRSFTGTYLIGPEGRGTMQFCEDITTACTAGAATAFFQIAVFSTQQTQIIEYSSPGTTSVQLTTGGEIISQDQSIFSAGNSNLVGSYSFNFAGVSSGTAAESAAGDFTADGHGVISAGGAATPGSMDINAGGAQTLAASSYAINANGRGTATIGSLNFSFYMISASRAKFIETDSAPASILVGDAFKQQTSVTCAWGLNALNGAYLLETSGAVSSTEIADLVSFTADGNGGVTAASIDENNGGSFTSTSSLSGSYQVVDPCGRGTLGISGHSYVFYIISPSRAVIQETTSGVVAHGFLVQPQGGPFTNASLSGSYALRLAGTNAAGSAGQREDIVGQLTADGIGDVTSGSLDINDFGVTQTVAPNIGTYLPTPAGTLRGTMVFGSPARNFVLYMVSPTQFFVLGTDSTGTAIGSLYNQF